MAGGLGALGLAALTTTLSPLPAVAGVKRLKNAPVVKLPSGVEYQDMALGSGATPQQGDRVAVHYSLYYNGLEVESSRDSSGLAARPYGFNWGTEKGTGSICKGVQIGMGGMQIGIATIHYLSTHVPPTHPPTTTLPTHNHPQI